ncbi:MAG: hypothetical protein ACPGN3_05225 [Opitutales bacterium]
MQDTKFQELKQAIVEYIGRDEERPQQCFSVQFEASLSASDQENLVLESNLFRALEIDALSDEFKVRLWYWGRGNLTSQKIGQLFVAVASEARWIEDPETWRILQVICSGWIKESLQGPNVFQERFFYPSCGRCGGDSMTRFLKQSVVQPVRVSHEPYAAIIYALRAFAYAGDDSSDVLGAFLHFLVERFDCLGGNPVNFVLEEFLRVCPYRPVVLEMKRSTESHIESIMNRNYHYSDRDSVTNRIRGDEPGWESLDRREKVKRYLELGDMSMRRARLSNPDVEWIEGDLEDYSKYANQAMRALGWQSRGDVPHTNTIPKYRVFSYDERRALFGHFKRKNCTDVPKEDIEKILSEAL